ERVDGDRDRQRIRLLGLVLDDIGFDEVFEEPLLHNRPRFPVGLTGSLWKKSILGPAFKGCQDHARELRFPGVGPGGDATAVRHPGRPPGSLALLTSTPPFSTRRH